jgi:hypothetical protein
MRAEPVRQAAVHHASRGICVFGRARAGAGSALNSYHKGGPSQLDCLWPLVLQYAQILLSIEPVGSHLPTITPSYDSFNLDRFFVLSGRDDDLFVKSRNLFFWSSFFVIFLIPVLNIVPLPIMIANRYLYISQVGFGSSCLCFSSTCRAPTALSTLQTAAHRYLHMAAFLGYQTFQTTKVWRNSYTLWTDTIEKDFLMMSLTTTLVMVSRSETIEPLRSRVPHFASNSPGLPPSTSGHRRILLRERADRPCLEEVLCRSERRT